MRKLIVQIFYKNGSVGNFQNIRGQEVIKKTSDPNNIKYLFVKLPPWLLIE